MVRNILSGICLIFFVLDVGLGKGMAYRFVDIGDPYPAFCAQQLGGGELCSDRYADQIVIITFVKPDQRYSQETLIDLQSIQQRYAQKQVAVLAIVSGTVDKAALTRFVKEQGISFPLVLDPDRKIYGQFGVFVYPSTGIFGPDTRLKYYLPARRINFRQHVEGYVRFLRGEISAEELEQIIHPVVAKTDARYKKAEEYYNFARIYFRQGKLDQARRILDLALKSSAEYAPAYSLYGYIYLQKGAYQQALEKFELALSIDPQLAEAQAGRERCLEKLQ
ncbi:MAG: tetratricopeptide repeat protein [Nitrospinota bacterium]|nr:MAG: tetratricopeptide repeat protein [Nitrospinota bacterium]